MLVLCCPKLNYLLKHVFIHDSIMINIRDILSLYIVLDTQLALIHICRTFGVSCDSVKSKLKNQISAWTTADNCKNGGEKCLYKVCMTNPLQSYYCFTNSFNRVNKPIWSKWFSGYRC